MRPQVGTDAHKTGGFAELVCSNSFRSDDAEQNAVGLLHWEMRRAGSLIMAMADRHQVPAGGALAVDRDAFSEEVTATLKRHPLVTRGGRRGRGPAAGGLGAASSSPPGPLTSPALAEAIRALTGEESLAFFDAIAPIVHRETIDMDVAWFQSRYDKVGPGGTGKDYINCPMDREQYEAFVRALIEGEKTDFKEWEKSTPYFDGCLPIEVMAERGPETLRHGPMKPRGLTNAHNPEVKPYAVVQLRQDNKLGTLYNMVGFQTKLKYADQVKVFRTIPGLEKAEFARLGGLHRNTFLNSPRVLDGLLRLKADPRLRFAGQVTGVEGYVESAAMGLMAGRMAAAEALGQPFHVPPPTTAHGALINHITGGHIETTDRAELILPADERELRPVPAHREGEGEGRRAAEAHRTGGGAQARLHGAGDGGFRRVARRWRARRRRSSRAHSAAAGQPERQLRCLNPTALRRPPHHQLALERRDAQQLVRRLRDALQVGAASGSPAGRPGSTDFGSAGSSAIASASRFSRMGDRRLPHPCLGQEGIAVARVAEDQRQALGHAGKARGLAGLRRRVAVEDHRGHLDQARMGFAEIGLEFGEARHPVLEQVELARGDEIEERLLRQAARGDGGEQRLGHRMAAAASYRSRACRATIAGGSGRCWDRSPGRGCA